jgi:DNA-3-methyladenine glycosylase I
MNRCFWCGEDELYCDYHDNEWGIPVYNDTKLFEMLVLEGAQAGLSWYTILKKRIGYRKAFLGFDIKKLARLNVPANKDKKETLKEKLLQDAGIVRNKLKIESVFINAEKFLEVQKEFGSFSEYLWRFTEHKIIKNKVRERKDILATSALSDTISKDLKKRGFKFVGSTIIYAYLQAVGVVDDHFEDCFKRVKNK